MSGSVLAMMQVKAWLCRGLQLTEVECGQDPPRLYCTGGHALILRLLLDASVNKCLRQDYVVGSKHVIRKVLHESEQYLESGVRIYRHQQRCSDSGICRCEIVTSRWRARYYLLMAACNPECDVPPSCSLTNPLDNGILG